MLCVKYNDTELSPHNKHDKPDMNTTVRISPNHQNNSGDITLPSGLRLGRYRLLNQIGQGGFGITYLALNKETNEQVVIKENLPHFCAYRKATLEVSPIDTTDAAIYYRHTLKRFIDEARLLANLKHPNIVTVREAFEGLGTAYFVMPFIRGKELHKAAPAVVNEAWLRPILMAILSALDYLHGKNLLHRDIKPHNILLQEDHTPILIDFGTARAMHSEATSTMVSSFGYTPPEQMDPHGKRGPWTDLYALGATCYVLIVGELPPSGIERLDDDSAYHPLLKRKELRKHFSPELLHSIDKALSVRSHMRWQTAKEWMNALEAPTTAGTAPCGATPASPPEKINNATEKNPIFTHYLPLLILGITLLLVLVSTSVNHLSISSSEEPAPHEHTEPTNVTPPLVETSTEETTTTEKEPGSTKDTTPPEELASTVDTTTEEPRSSENTTPPEELTSTENTTTEKTPEEEEVSTAPAISEAEQKEAQQKLQALGITDYNAALLTACANPELMQLILRAGADVNTQREDGATALYIAAKEGKRENVPCLEQLLAVKGIDVNKPDKENHTPLHRAALDDRITCVDRLLASKGIDVNMPNKGGRTPLMAAATGGHFTCVEKLLRAEGIDINAKDVNGNTALHRTVMSRMRHRHHSKCLELLLAAEGIDINAENNKGNTALHIAASLGNSTFVKRLLAAEGIDIHRKNNNGKTPFQVAKGECKKILYAAGNP